MKKLFQSITIWVAKTFGKAFNFLKANSQIAVNVTKILKDAVESPIAGIVVNLIPGTVDNELLYKLRKIIPEVANKTAIAHSIYQTAKTSSEAVGAIIAYLKEMNPEGRIGFWVTFAGELNIALSDGKLTISESIILTQMAYKELFEKK